MIFKILSHYISPQCVFMYCGFAKCSNIVLAVFETNRFFYIFVVCSGLIIMDSKIFCSCWDCGAHPPVNVVLRHNQDPAVWIILSEPNQSQSRGEADEFEIFWGRRGKTTPVLRSLLSVDILLGIGLVNVFDHFVCRSVLLWTKLSRGPIWRTSSGLSDAPFLWKRWDIFLHLF